ncbi:HAD-IA family hydrolase [Exilibacterium tricleocarpae]|uniref:HAD-IA family hydrolase n=1 Tax=Exilibacterium tricleocarpae TaxID=2591008 RepID=A0A545U403_9GAMM|nr:HAD-IA family hydrolase [Exilibacterium tricleocarpae]TQV84202.1 HAD-IA family hydrolase [Exilibacterium tricleocarpae]
MTLKAVLFDLDGTLLDTAPDFVVTLNQLLAQEGRAPLPAERIRATVSEGARALVTLGFELTETDSDFEPLRQRLLAIYRDNLAVHTRLFDGIAPLLQQCTARDLAWGIVTNKPDAYTQPLLQALALAPGVTVCPDHVSQTKPDPEPLLLACTRLNCDTGDAIYIGDHVRDIECGRRAGMPTIAAAYGYLADTGAASQWDADHIAHSATELWPIIEGYL